MSTEPVVLHGPDIGAGGGGLYDRLRCEHGPVIPVLLEGDVPAWLVIGYRELQDVLTRPDTFARDSRRWNAWDRVPPDWPLMPLVMPMPTVLNAEGDEHRRRAGAIAEALAAIDQHELRTVTTRFADRLIDGFCAAGSADLRAAYSSRLPALVLAWAYGLEEEHGGALATVMTTMLDGGPDSMAAQGTLLAEMTALVAARRAAPGPDVVSHLIGHREEFTDEELIPELIVLLGGGHQPTGEWIGNALRLMLTDDRFGASLSGSRLSVSEALNEVLWEDTPTQIYAGRFAAHDVDLGGRRVRTGDLILLGLAGANRDPALHRAPGGHQANRSHLSFSHGDHRCPHSAREMAEIIAVTAVEVLLDRLPDLELSVPAGELRWRPSPWMRGVTGLPVVFSSAPPLHLPPL
ncbi:cytochrome P450 [Nocardiopsis lambiniae]|uniref:Cytochrome P450 n=1 Tax=Nocardiopsis lambiniae TaxID=3075539 RepID=A0ABU2MH08_9ACTN|nr:cytochrome P450 [Nocardiopsis sp. DSM 44743]MDT0331983.1 cytochrome P450 [Nocardiopsis sp. DSM 44743]